MIRLSKRLQTVVSMVTHGNSVADVGCDHAHTGIFLIQSGVSTKVLAMDLRRGPLEKAEENVKEAGLADKIELRLSDGLQRLGEGETDTILISGMGGPLILSILEKELKKAKAAKELILSPQSDLEGFEEGLKNLGFVAQAVRIEEDEGKFYFIYRAVQAKEGCPSGISADDHQKTVDVLPHDIYLKYLEKEKASKETVLKKIKADSGEKAAARRDELYNDIRRIEDEINRMRS
ncbi:MAG: class I SAM-dependent methyltransferase [Lachnospiraceae bacterium]|nr:class I SAM-dependent methyltransferase [Lachnospiraceae bacterium]